MNSTKDFLTETPCCNKNLSFPKREVILQSFKKIYKIDVHVEILKITLMYHSNFKCQYIKLC